MVLEVVVAVIGRSELCQFICIKGANKEYVEITKVLAGVTRITSVGMVISLMSVESVMTVVTAAAVIGMA